MAVLCRPFVQSLIPHYMRRTVMICTRIEMMYTNKQLRSFQLSQGPNQLSRLE